MIKNIIFDIGGVLLDYNPRTYLDKLNIEENKRNYINSIIFHSQEWKNCLNGIINNDELITILTNKNIKYKKEITQILVKDNLKYMLPPKLDSISYLRKLKKNGYKIYLLSNSTEDTYYYIKNTFDIIQNSDGEIFSCFEGISKPKEDIYLRLIEKYNILPSESVFIDDTQRNLDIAERLKFRCVKFNNLEELKERIVGMEK